MQCHAQDLHIQLVGRGGHREDEAVRILQQDCLGQSLRPDTSRRPIAGRADERSPKNSKIDFFESKGVTYGCCDTHSVQTPRSARHYRRGGCLHKLYRTPVTEPTGTNPVYKLTPPRNRGGEL